MSTLTKPATKITAHASVSVERSGTKIILPEGMSYADGREWLLRQEKSEESTVRVISEIKCFPFDGIIALNKAMEREYGFVEAGDEGFWGKQPPTVVKVPLADGTFANAVLGEIRCPKWEGGYLEATINGSSILIKGEVKKKFETEVNRIIAMAQAIVTNESVYRGQAIHLDLEWMSGKRAFSVLKDQPKFMNIKGGKLILTRLVETQLNTSVFMLIEKTEACRANNIPLKHGALFTGSFGTGKTLTAKVTAAKAVANGWTFIYLKAADQLADGLRIAQMYSPSVVFVEDIDTSVNNRDINMNDILNTLDGVDTKDSPIITILTTNKVEDIEPAFLRAGRIDTVVHYTPPDAETAARFVQEMGGELLSDDVDFPLVGKALDGLVAAFIAEAISKAKRNAIYRTGNADITGQITTEDLIAAAEVVQNHAALIKPKTLTPEQTLANAVATVNQHGIGQTLGDIEAIAKNIESQV